MVSKPQPSSPFSFLLLSLHFTAVRMVCRMPYGRLVPLSDFILARVISASLCTHRRYTIVLTTFSVRVMSIEASEAMVTSRAPARPAMLAERVRAGMIAIVEAKQPCSRNNKFGRFACCHRPFLQTHRMHAPQGAGGAQRTAGRRKSREARGVRGARAARPWHGH